MNSFQFSRLPNNFLKRSSGSSRQLNRLSWSYSTLSPHPKSKQKNLIALGSFLGTLREKVDDWLEKEEREILDLRRPAPYLKKPLERIQTTYRLPRYFSKGALDYDKKKTPSPILYLLTETNEVSQARPVPGNALLLRSICKGKGVLRQNGQGLVYLDIDNRFISTLIPYLKVSGLVRPPYFNLFGTPEGAHIPVIPSREVGFQYLEKINELDQTFSFEIMGLYSIEPSIWPEVEQVWFFQIKSPELEKLRRRYFLPSLPGGHPFHIAVAVKPRPSVLRQPRYLPTMRINIGLLVA